MTHHLNCQELPTRRQWGWHGIALPLNFTHLCTTEMMQHYSWPWKVFCWLPEIISPYLARTSVPAHRHAPRLSLKQQLWMWEVAQVVFSVQAHVMMQAKPPGLVAIKSGVGHWNCTSVGKNEVWGFAGFFKQQICFLFCFLNSRFKALCISWQCGLSKAAQM